MIRPEVDRLVSMGPLPPENKPDPALVDASGDAAKAIARPVTTEEAEALLTVFGPDDCFGLAWTLLHLIETAPESPIRSEPPSDAIKWVRYVWERAHC